VHGARPAGRRARGGRSCLVHAAPIGCVGGWRSPEQGLTNLVPRATARADELTDDEVRAGLPAVAALAARVQPRWVAFLGMTAYRTATGNRKAVVGPQPERLGDAHVWLLPNPSGLNASWQLPRLVEAYAELRRAAS
jgi:TDG/mug DNA glycosylase family protein